MSALRVALTTMPNADSAQALGRRLVERKLAGCVQYVPITSCYRWAGAIQEDAETLMIMKTHADTVGDLETAVCQEHPYDVPQFITLTADHANHAYLQWIQGGIT